MITAKKTMLESGNLPNAKEMRMIGRFKRTNKANTKYLFFIISSLLGTYQICQRICSKV